MLLNIHVGPISGKPVGLYSSLLNANKIKQMGNYKLLNFLKWTFYAYTVHVGPTYKSHIKVIKGI